MLNSKEVWGIADLCGGSLGRRMLVRVERKFTTSQSIRFVLITQMRGESS